MFYIKRLLYLFCFVTVVFLIYSISNSDNPEKEREALKEQHCNTDWSDIGVEDKKKLLSEFIDEDGMNVPISQTAYKALHNAVKFPETILINGEEPSGYISFRDGDASIVDAEKGLIRFFKDFTAKNKMNMDVRSRMMLEVKYTAGCQDYQVTNFKIE